MFVHGSETHGGLAETRQMVLPCISISVQQKNVMSELQIQRLFSKLPSSNTLYYGLVFYNKLRHSGITVTMCGIYALCIFACYTYICVCLHNYFQIVCLWSRNSVISLVPGLWVVRFRQAQGIYFFSETSQPVILSAQLPMQWVPDRFSPTAKAAGA